MEELKRHVAKGQNEVVAQWPFFRLKRNAAEGDIAKLKQFKITLQRKIFAVEFGDELPATEFATLILTAFARAGLLFARFRLKLLDQFARGFVDCGAHLLV